MKVYLVEDSDLIRERLAALLQEIPGLTICGEAAEPDEALIGIGTSLPDVVVLDVQLIGGSGLTVLSELAKHAPTIKSIVLTNYAVPQIRQQCIKAGAAYFFDKTTEFTKVREAIEALSKQSSANTIH